MASFWRGLLFAGTGVRHFGRSGYERRKETFDPTDIQEEYVKNRSFLITGANSGLGKAAAITLAKLGGEVHMVCRNRERGEQAQNEIRTESGNDRVHLHILDVSRPTQVRDFVRDFVAARSPLHVLVNNAGVMLDKKQTTEDGIDTTFATNTLGTFLMTVLLVPWLHECAVAAGEPSRVITVSSGGMLTQKMCVSDLQFNKSYEGTQAYAQTKREQAYLNELFAERFKDKNVRFYCMHPGWADTPGVQSSMPGFYERTKSMLRNDFEGSDTTVWLACCTKPALQEASGKFYFDREEAECHLTGAFTQSPHEDVQRLWDECCRLCDWSLDAASADASTATTSTTTTSSTASSTSAAGTSGEAE